MNSGGIDKNKIDIGKAKRFSHFHDNLIQLSHPLKSNISLKQKVTNFYERNFLLRTINPVANNFICISNDSYYYSLVVNKITI